MRSTSVTPPSQTIDERIDEIDDVVEVVLVSDTSSTLSHGAMKKKPRSSNTSAHTLVKRHRKGAIDGNSHCLVTKSAEERRAAQRRKHGEEASKEKELVRAAKKIDAGKEEDEKAACSPPAVAAPNKKVSLHHRIYLRFRRGRIHLIPERLTFSDHPQSLDSG